MTDSDIRNELRLVMEFLERTAIDADTPAEIAEECRERVAGLRPVLDEMEGR